MRNQDRENQRCRSVRELFAEYRQRMENGEIISWSQFDGRLTAICSPVGDYQQAKQYVISAGYAYPDVFKEYARAFPCTEYDYVLRQQTS